MYNFSLYIKNIIIAHSQYNSLYTPFFILKSLYILFQLLSLKAELHKKREEVIDKKQLPHNRIENYKCPPSKSSNKTGDKETKKSFKDGLKAVDTEELEACRKAKYVHIIDPYQKSLK